jgi:hypothetical protein
MSTTPTAEQLAPADRYPHHTDAELLQLNRILTREWQEDRDNEAKQRAVIHTGEALTARGL